MPSLSHLLQLREETRRRGNAQKRKEKNKPGRTESKTKYKKSTRPFILRFLLSKKTRLSISRFLSLPYFLSLSLSRANCPIYHYLFLSHSLKHRRPGRALLLVRLEVLVDNRHGQQNPGPASDSTHEVGDDRQGTDAHPAKGRCGRDVAVELLAQRLDRVAVALEEHALLAERLGDVVGRGTRDLDPGLGEERAGAQHEPDIEERVDGAGRGLCERSGRGDVVDKPTDRVHVRSTGAALRVGPAAEEADEDVAAVALEEELRDEVEVGDEGGLFGCVVVSRERRVGGSGEKKKREKEERVRSRGKRKRKREKNIQAQKNLPPLSLHLSSPAG